MINRRTFFSALAGAIGGVFAAFVPKAKPDVMPVFGPDDWVDGCDCSHCVAAHKKAQKRSGTEFVCNFRCNCRTQRLVLLNDRIMVFCDNHAPYYINDDGKKESVFYYPRAIDIKEQHS